MSENNFVSNVESMFRGLDSFVSASTVVGEAIHFGDTIILPLADVTFGVGAGAYNDDKKNNGGGGLGGKITPSAVLVIQNGHTKLVNVKNQTSMTKILDMVPDIIDRFTKEKDVDLNEVAKEVSREKRKTENTSTNEQANDSSEETT